MKKVLFVNIAIICIMILAFAMTGCKQPKEEKSKQAEQQVTLPAPASQGTPAVPAAAAPIAVTEGTNVKPAIQQTPAVPAASAVATTTPAATSAPSTPATPAAVSPEKQVKVIGNKDSKRYHLPGMKYYDKVEAYHRVEFNSEEEATKAGYSKAPK